MMKKLVGVLLIFSLLSLVSCFTNIHTVGEGAQGDETVSKKQWFALWGLVPLSEIDSQDLAEGASDYTVRTEFTPVDIIIGAFTSVISLQPMTVQVTK